VVGDRLHDDPGVFAQAIVAIDTIPLRLVSQASSRRTFTFVLRDAEVPEAMTRLHNAFFSD
jgi:aspartokinase